MSRLIQIAASLRLYMLLFTVPYGLMWADGRSSGGWLMVLTHALLVQYYLATFDQAALAEGQDPRLALAHDRHRFDARLVGIARSMLAVVLVVLVLVLLLGHPVLGATALAAAVMITLLTGGVTGQSSAWRMRFAEFLWPLVVLIGPMLLLRELAARAVAGEPVGGGMPAGVQAATLMGAVMLGAYVLACMMRDEAMDRVIGLRTAATTFGRAGSTFYLFLWLGGAVGLASWGVGRGFWPWGVALVVGLASMELLRSATARREGAGLAWWVLAQGVSVLVISASLA